MNKHFCSICTESLELEKAAEHWVFDFTGELDYIELAHTECAQTQKFEQDWEIYYVS